MSPPPSPGRDRPAEPAADPATASGRAYPLRPLIGVGVVVWRGDEVLLIRRARPPRAGEWSLPGGLQRLGETVADTGRREVREETGLEVTIGGLIDVVDLIERDDVDGRVRWHYTLVDLYATCGDTALPVACSDASEACWCPLATLSGLGLWPETLRIITRARRLCESGLAPTGPGGAG